MYSSATPIGSAVRSTTPIRSVTPTRAARVLGTVEHEPYATSGISAVSSSAPTFAAKVIEPTYTTGTSYAQTIEPASTSYPTYGGATYVQEGSSYASTTAAVAASGTTYRSVEPTSYVGGTTTYVQGAAAAPAPLQSSTVTTADPSELAGAPVIGGQTPIVKSTTTTTTYTYAPQTPGAAAAPAVGSSTYMPGATGVQPAGSTTYTYASGAQPMADVAGSTNYTYASGAQPMANVAGSTTYTYAAGAQPMGMPAVGAATMAPAAGMVSGAPQFVFGASGPQTDSPGAAATAEPETPAPTYTVGQSVDVWSDGQGCWIAAEVTAVQPDGTVTARYGGSQKDIAPSFLKQYLRPSAKQLDMPAPPPPGPAMPPVPTYAVGQAVEVFSKSDGAWVGAEVQAVSPQGVVTVRWARNQKDIAPEYLYDFLRPAAPVFAQQSDSGYAVPATCAQAPMTMGPGAPGPAPVTPAGAHIRYDVGEAVEVFSKSEGNWVPAQVIQVEGDGTVIVRYGHNQKNIPPCEYDRYLKKAGVAMAPVDTLYMPPTNAYEAPKSASYVAPPVNESAYEAPPTAFGPNSGMVAPPTAYGAAGFPMGVEAPPTAYQQPPTLPGGYS